MTEEQKPGGGDDYAGRPDRVPEGKPTEEPKGTDAPESSGGDLPEGVHEGEENRAEADTPTRIRGRAAPGWQERVLANLRIIPIPLVACENAGVSRSWAYEYKAKTPEFERQWTAAQEEGYDRAEAAAWERGVAGVEEPIYGNVRGTDGTNQGTGKVGTKVVYSDKLLELILRGRRREVYGERVDVHTSGAGVDREVVELFADLRKMAKAGVRALAGKPILEAEVVDNGSGPHANGQDPKSDDLGGSDGSDDAGE